MKNESQLRQSGGGLTRKQFFGTMGVALLFPWLALFRNLSQGAGRPKPPVAPRLDPVLWAWLKAKRTPVFESADPDIQFLIAAVLAQQPVEFRYWGGSEPGRERRVTPALVFHIETSETLYLAGYCHARQQERVFRVKNMARPNRPTEERTEV